MAESLHLKTAEDVFQWMKQGCTQGVHPGLERMEWMCKRLGHPERRLKTIHIAGTNGKGSTSAMVASILKEAGYPTGMFTSPYLQHWSERITMDGEPIPESEFVRWATEVITLTEERAGQGKDRVTEFEFWTLLALLYFAREAVPWFVVWETGLGGRLDSTNVVIPLISVITNVGHDHQGFLGETLLEIAREKAGIIKPGVPVICSSEDESVLAVIEEQAKEKRSRFYRLEQDFRAIPRPREREDGESIHFEGPYRQLNNLFIPLVGEHQVKNGATALMVCEVLRQFYATVMEEEEVRAGLARAVWPGRLETIAVQPRILLDGAHNREGARALAKALASYKYEKLHLLLGVGIDKEAEEILVPLLPFVDTMIVSQSDDPRSLPAESLVDMVRSIHPEVELRLIEDPVKGVSLLREEADKQDMIVVAGSLFLVAEVRRGLTT
ncbi:bifunctional folylpolyglutamate synthase/dihydrofolate synthase [Marininema mesophilum]|nr:folylpolyglutamate synthase/dihydrofolate synthase family protein [Marininema mesophilum]